MLLLFSMMTFAILHGSGMTGFKRRASPYCCTELVFFPESHNGGRVAEQLECSLFVSLSQKPPIRREDNFSLIIIIIKSLNYYFMVFTNYMHKPEGFNLTMNWRESRKHNPWVSR